MEVDFRKLSIVKKFFTGLYWKIFKESIKKEINYDFI